MRGCDEDMDCVLLSNWARLPPNSPPLCGLSRDEEEEEVDDGNDLIVTSFKSLNTDYRREQCTYIHVHD